MSDKPDGGGRQYARYLGAAAHHALLMMLRRKRVALAILVTLAPVLIPLAVAFLSLSQFAAEGNRIFVMLVEQVYLKALAPLLALFYGCMLIGEDVELQVITYLLTRPLPRSALVLGRFLAYLAISTVILLTSMALLFAACTTAGGLQVSPSTLRLWLHYAGVVVVALSAYGAFAVLLGALTQRPIIYGVVFLFGWQRLVSLIPGAADFLTLEKYVNALLPRLATQRENEVLRVALVEFQKQQILVAWPKALLTLVVVIGVLLTITCLVLRLREYSRARAVGA